MRARVLGRTLAGSLKYFDTVGRESPLSAANSSMFRILYSLMNSPLSRVSGGAARSFRSMASRNSQNMTRVKLFLATGGPCGFRAGGHSVPDDDRLGREVAPCMEAVTFSVTDAVNVLSEAGSCRTPFSPLVAAPGAICLAESQQSGRDALDPRSTCHAPREVQAVTGHQTLAMVRT